MTTCLNIFTLGDDPQRAAICRALLRSEGLTDLWEWDRPSDAAKALRRNLGSLAVPARTLFLIAWDIWNAHGRASVAEALRDLDSRALASVGSLFLACAQGPLSVAAWRWHEERGVPSA